jgi:hypothetical protein
MPLESIICRRLLDEERGNPWICACPLCEQQRKEANLLKSGEESDMGQEDISSPGVSCEAARDKRG